MKNDNIMLFKFSNNHYQVCLDKSDKTLLITENELVLVTIRDGMEVGRHVENKENYVESKNKDLISLYLKFRKINAQITQMKK